MSDNLAQINAVIESLKGRLKPDKKLMTAIAGEMLASVEDNFRNEGSDMPWKPLAPSTVKLKRKRNMVQKILQARGNLFKSIQSSATDNEAIVGTNKIYAAIHNYGGVINIGARTRTLFHRTDQKGELLRRSIKGPGSSSSMLIFAKKSHKRKAAYTFGQNAYQIKIQARPFMILTDVYKNNIIEIIKRQVSIN